MPITAKLPRQFYERLRDEVANELEDLLDAIDASSHHEIRETIEAATSRLEAQVIARFEHRFGDAHAVRQAECEQVFVCPWQCSRT